MAKAAPSTAPANPLEESLAKIMGEGLSEDTGTSPLAYENQGFRQPQADVINISGSPGTGATTSETWSHDIALENLRREQLQFEYEQQQNEVANALRQQEAMRAEAESQRQAEQLALTKQTTAQQLATAQQQMGSETQRQAQTKQQMQYATTGEVRAAQKAQQDYAVAQQAMALQRTEEKRKADEAAMKYGIYGNYETMRQAMMATGREMAATGYAPVGSPTVTAYRQATIPGYVPSYAEKLNAQQLGANYNAASFYDPSTNRVYSAPPATPTGPSYYDMALRKQVYR